MLFYSHELPLHVTCWLETPYVFEHCGVLLLQAKNRLRRYCMFTQGLGQLV